MSHRCRLFMSAVAALSMSAVASADDIEVSQSGGQALQSAEPTEVTFTSMLPGQTVSIERIRSTTSGIGTGYGYTVSSYGQVTEPLCSTPCTLTLQPGSYSLRAGDSLYSPTLNIDASGGTRSWEVRDIQPGRVTTGLLGASVGAGLLLSGGVLAALSDDGEGAGLIALGIPLTAVSIPLITGGMGKVREKARW